MISRIIPGILLVASLSGPCLALNEIAVYKAENLESSGGGLVWRDSAGNNNLQMSDPTGVTVGEQPTVGDDQKSAVFTGDQIVALRTTTPLAAPTGELEVSLAFNPTGEAGTEDQTIVRQGNWELRYSPEKKTLMFIVWHDTKVYTQITAPAEPGVWQEVKAAFREDTLKLEVNGVPQTKDAKGPLGTHHPTSAIFIGASTSARTGSGIEFRPLRGAIADVRIAGQ